jgi:hypothetical protein
MARAFTTKNPTPGCDLVFLLRRPRVGPVSPRAGLPIALGECAKCHTPLWVASGETELLRARGIRGVTVCDRDQCGWVGDSVQPGEVPPGL